MASNEKGSTSIQGEIVLWQLMENYIYQTDIEARICLPNILFMRHLGEVGYKLCTRFYRKGDVDFL